MGWCDLGRLLLGAERGGTSDLCVFTLPWCLRHNRLPIDRLACAVRSIFQSPLIFKWQALSATVPLFSITLPQSSACLFCLFCSNSIKILNGFLRTDIFFRLRISYSASGEERQWRRKIRGKSTDEVIGMQISFIVYQLGGCNKLRKRYIMQTSKKLSYKYVDDLIRWS